MNSTIKRSTDERVREGDAAHRTALSRCPDEASAAASADAAVIVVALERQHAHPDRMPDAPGSTAWRSKDLVPLSLALGSPVVQDIRAHHRFPAESSRP
ncbi:hypothetical protein [Streptomyces murinus]|uniref:hypothetical protein n=1 Tax=Streptomyces murinus TaxID=33900 RepID=UPI0021141EDB|nr:hypothetical protein [Streptomyces murinus]